MKRFWIIACLLPLCGQAAAFFAPTGQCLMTEGLTPELAAVIEITEGPKGVSYRRLGEPATPRGRNDLARWQRAADNVLQCTQRKIAEAEAEDKALEAALRQARAWPPAQQWAGTAEDDAVASDALDLEWAGAPWLCSRRTPKDWRNCYQEHLETLESQLKENQAKDAAFRQKLWTHARTQLSQRADAPDTTAQRVQACDIVSASLYSFLDLVQAYGREYLREGFSLALNPLDTVAGLSGETTRTRGGVVELMESALKDALQELERQGSDYYNADREQMQPRFTAQAQALRARCLQLPAQ